ncbi:MAG: acetyl-CoA carboxylase biotin carboxyl carrier protein subunit, partial [Lentisphaeria bacterium]|nr:acetyl-CoA carboxylase biotin carboxyl carrier protein subunit [Lentisphaeria bacterium]
TVGDTLNINDTLCLLEAMKLFRPISLSVFNTMDTDIYPDRNYKIVRINPANSQAVNKGDLLFVIEPV